ncbi:MAG: very short patch repair endonuclease [Pyrinomonadaceae bacterium]|nr:very short patch repair endonuclease [Pyrinomonadaceae bacterium]
MKKVTQPSLRESSRNTRRVVAPSFIGLKPASLASSYAKQRNRGSDTAHEVMLRRELWHLGLRYRKTVRTLPGKPDIVFSRRRLAIFCDGDFWHGREWRKLRLKLKAGSNSSYWLKKIQSNIQRDRHNQTLLQCAGWTVIRLWESDIKRDPKKEAALIKREIEKLSH